MNIDINVDIVKCLVEVTQTVMEVDISTLASCPHLNDIMLLLGEAAVRVNEKSLNALLLGFANTLVFGRKAQNIVFQYLDIITQIIFSCLKKE